MSQAPYSGTPEQVARMLQAMVQSAAYTAEVQRLKTQNGTGAWTSVIHDANGGQHNLSIQDTEFADLSWVEESANLVVVSDEFRFIPRLPLVVLVTRPGRMVPSSQAGEFAAFDGDHGFAVQEWTVDAAVFSANADPQAAQRKAMLQATAIASLVRRNPALGGLVALCDPLGPAEPGGAGKIGGHGIVGAARVRLRVVAVDAF